MPVNPLVGYDTGGAVGPANKNQWIHDFAMTYANMIANGSISNSPTAGPGAIFSNEFWDKYGLGRIDETILGSGIISPTLYNQLVSLGGVLVDNWGSLDPSQRAGLSSPVGLPSSGGLPMDEIDRNNTAAGARQAAADEAANARNAADNATQVQITGMQESGANARNAAQIASGEKIAGIQSADTRYGIDTRAAVDREDIAARERIAAGDRTSREGISDKDRAESARQFDFGLAEDARQFNSDLLFNLFDRGIQLAQKPVDWLGYQYWLDNVGIAASALTLSSAAAVFGAIPPSGPSAAGPVIGGPGIIYGDTELSQSLGIQNAGPVTVEEAVAANPGGGTIAPAPEWSAQATVERFGGAERMDVALNDARESTLPEDIAGSEFGNRVRQLSNRYREAKLAQGADPAVLGQPNAAAALGAPPPIPGATPGQGIRRGDTGRAALPPPPPELMMSAPVDTLGAPPALPTAPAPPAQPPAGAQMSAPVDNLAGATPGAVGGIHTGNEAGTASTNALGGANTAQAGPIDQLLGQLANVSGIPIEQLRNLFPANLMGQGGSQEAIANSPIIQALRGNSPLSSFNTGPTSGSKFTQIQSTGTETGVRGGQDVNASTYLTALPSQREMMQGAIEAQGQYFPDFMQQLFRSSPVSNLETGSFGRRRF